MIATFVAGRYSSTLQFPSASALTLGITEEGYHLSLQHKWDVVESTDAYGVNGTIVEKFFQGTVMRVAGVFKEWLPNVIKSIQPMNGWAGTGVSTFNLGTIGAAATDNAGILVMTATAGTPAASSPTSMTFTYALQDESDVTLTFGPKHRTMPFSFQIFPYSSSGIKFFSST